MLDRQRQAHLSRMRDLRALRRDGDLLVQLDADFEMFHLDADLKWIDAAQARLDRLATVVRQTAARPPGDPQDGAGQPGDLPNPEETP